MTPFILGYDRVHPSTLKPGKDNPRKRLKTSNPAGYATLKASLVDGQWEPLLVEKASMTIISGHQRWEVAKELDMELDVCYLRPLTDNERRTIMVKANTHEGIFHTEALATFIEGLDLPSLSFDPTVLSDLAPLSHDPIPDDKEQKWTTMKVKVTKDAEQNILAAFQKVRDNAESPKMKDGTCLEYICAEYLATP